MPKLNNKNDLQYKIRSLHALNPEKLNEKKCLNFGHPTHHETPSQKPHSQ